MASDLLRFSKYVRDTEVNKEYNSKLESYDIFSRKEEYRFHLCATWIYPFGMTLGGTYHWLLDIDEEDMNYFKGKYLTKIQDELHKKINELTKEYSECNLLDADKIKL